MKKTFFMIAAILSMAFAAPAYAEDGEQVDLQVSIENPTSQHGGTHKAPPRVPQNQIPVVFLNGHTLQFSTPCEGATLQLLDEEGFVVYTVTIPTGTTVIQLPSDLEGEFELQIIRGRYCFFGWIEL
ncbi:MAG: hypothetical protein IJ605_06920 [Prevotella sp.]|nr:hypothetical protein [Prevotella sp.]